MENLTPEQEEAICQMYQSFGFCQGLSEALSVLEDKLGPMHFATIEVRKMLNYGKGRDARIKSEIMITNSGLDTVLIDRVKF